MRSIAMGCVGVLFAAVLATAADVEVGKEFQGKWTVTEIQSTDATLTADQLNNFGVTIDGAKMQWQIGDGMRKAKISFLDTKSSPKVIDIESLEGDQDGTVFEGIYEIDGDTLRMCLNLSTSMKQRPSEFTVPTGSTLVIVSLKQEKK